MPQAESSGKCAAITALTLADGVCAFGMIFDGG
jgi:hypothetical protein